MAKSFSFLVLFYFIVVDVINFYTTKGLNQKHPECLSGVLSKGDEVSVHPLLPLMFIKVLHAKKHVTYLLQCKNFTINLHKMFIVI